MIHLPGLHFPKYNQYYRHKAVSFSFGEAAEPEVLQNISTPQAYKTGWESQESELTHKIQAAALLRNTVCLLSLL